MKWNQSFNQAALESVAVAIVIVLLALLSILYLNRHRLRVLLREWRIKKSLDQIGCQQIRGLVCHDGLDGFFILDRLALTQNTVLLVSYKPYGGNIYCARHIAEWTQVIGQKSFKFDNPLLELDNQLTAIRQITGALPVRGILCFNDSASFPRGHPDQVMHLGNLPDECLSVDPDSVDAGTRVAWELLTRHYQDTVDTGPQSVKT